MTEEIVWTPSPGIVENSNMTAFMRELEVGDYATLLRRSAEEQEWFWDALIEHSGIRFFKPYERVLDLSGGMPWARWCVGGTTNLVLNCLDRHAGTPVAEREALAWEAEDGAVRRWTHAELDAATCRFAGALREMGFGPGDVIAIYAPFLPESVAAFLAIAKIGAMVLPLFSGFGAAAIIDRMNDGGAVGAVTVDGTLRRGKVVELKPVIDEVATAVKSLRRIVVIRRMQRVVAMDPDRDCWWDDAVAGQPPACPTEEVAADAPVVLAYTSGTTGKPKGTVLTHCGLLVKTALDIGLCMDFKAGDRLLWLSDMGWLVGPLVTITATSLAGTMVIAEGGPDYPEKGRMWRIVQDQQVSFLGVAPTTTRILMRYGVEEVERYDLSSIRVMTSTGEAWNPDAWRWCFEHVGKGKVPLHNYIGGTELSGGILSTTVIHPMKPGCFAGPIPGMGADVVDDAGRSLPPGEIGELVCRQASIGMTQGLWGDDGEGYLDAYWNTLPGLWVHGDFAYRDEDGFWFVPGRSDDAFNVGGKRVGPAEVESLVLATGRLVEAAAVGVHDDVKGTAIVCVCVAAEGHAANEDLDRALADAIVAGLGKPFRPREFLYVSDLPKTRNMKVMRRVVRATYTGDPPGDLAALVNPEAVDELSAVLAARRRS